MKRTGIKHAWRSATADAGSAKDRCMDAGMWVLSEDERITKATSVSALPGVENSGLEHFGDAQYLGTVVGESIPLGTWILLNAKEQQQWIRTMVSLQ